MLTATIRLVLFNLIGGSIVFVCLICTKGLQVSALTAGGEEAPAGQHPWQVHLYVNSSRLGLNKDWCGGVIIDNRHILTAAHCIATANSSKTIRANELSAFVGSRSISAGTRYTIESLIYHANYNSSDGHRNDIALLKSKQEIQFAWTGGDGSVNSVAMPTSNHAQYKEGDWFIVTGWGDIREGGPASATLKQVRVPYYDDQHCAKNYNADLRSQICAGVGKGEGPCYGDSGGPLVRQVGSIYELVGLVSLVTCGQGPVDTYTRADQLLDWIARAKWTLQ